TVAERYAAKSILLGSFFFLRGAGGRSTITRLIPTLAYQLSNSLPATEPLIRDVIRGEPAITRQSLKHQFKTLIVEPMLAARKTTRSRKTKYLVIVIDALDECDDKDLMREFIEVVIGAFQENNQLPFRVVVTSTVEEHIRQKLETPAARSVTHCLSLQDFDARSDIDKFFRVCFSNIYGENHRVMQNVSLPWPSKSDLNALVKKSDGLFIVAATLMNFIRGESGLPQEKLQRALSAETGLDTMYAQVFSRVAYDPNFHRVIGTIVLLRASLSITFLGELLQLQTAHIVQTLLGTQSIMMIPEGDDQPIQSFHTSLGDFLTVESRSAKFFINPPIRHLFITVDCLVAMAMRPSGGIVYSGGQKYGCLNWCYHLHQGFVEARDNSFDLLSKTSLTNHLKDFASQSHHLWVNTLIHTGWQIGMRDLNSALLILKQFPQCPPDLLLVLEDIKTKTELVCVLLW
ncbi:hypothetical protein PILCRDRAFT_11641, partial [Piloderma croceum F 1598]